MYNLSLLWCLYIKSSPDITALGSRELFMVESAAVDSPWAGQEHVLLGVWIDTFLPSDSYGKRRRLVFHLGR